MYAIARRPPRRVARRPREWIEQDLRAFDTSVLPDRVDGVVHLAQSRALPRVSRGRARTSSRSTSRRRSACSSTRAAPARARSCWPRPAGCTATGATRSARPTRPRPTTFYFRSKRAAELLRGLRRACSRHRVPVLLHLRRRPAANADPDADRQGDRAARRSSSTATRGFGSTRSTWTTPCARSSPRSSSAARRRSTSPASERVTITELVGLIGEIAGRAAGDRPQPGAAGGRPRGRHLSVCARSSACSPEISLGDGLRSAIGIPTPRP